MPKQDAAASIPLVPVFLLSLHRAGQDSEPPRSDRAAGGCALGWMW